MVSDALVIAGLSVQLGDRVSSSSMSPALGKMRLRNFAQNNKTEQKAKQASAPMNPMTQERAGMHDTRLHTFGADLLEELLVRAGHLKAV